MKSKLIFLVLPWLISISLGIYVLSSPYSAPATSTLGTSVSVIPTPSSALIYPDLPSSTCSTCTTFLVARVIDGDTIQLENGQTVRYIGIDTPETVHPNKPVECFGQQASEENKKLVLGKNVKLEKDISETDKYGRLLRYIWVGDTLVNDYLVRNGYAHSSSYSPDVKHQQQFLESQRYAHENKLGLWASGSCDSNLPNTPNHPNLPNPDCPIKGNISSSSEKIYHTEGQRYYDKTQIDETKGEKYFCTEKEAEDAGWRKSKV